MQFCPHCQLARIARVVHRLKRTRKSVRGGRGDHVGPHSLRAAVFSREVEKFPSEVSCSESEKILGRAQLDMAQCVIESHQDILTDIAGFIPAVNAREISEHLSRQSKQSVLRVLDDLISRRVISRS